MLYVSAYIYKMYIIYTHTEEYYSAMRKKKTLSLGTAWNLRTSVEQNKEKKTNGVTYMCNLKKPNSQKAKLEW